MTASDQPDDKRSASVPLPADEISEGETEENGDDLDDRDDVVIAQEPSGPGVRVGSGEFPPPNAPPTGPSPGG